jgi:hypothetical protein
MLVWSGLWARERVTAMRSSWKTEAGHLVCRWSEVGLGAQDNLGWIEETAEVHGSYLSPVPDFASHSPFGGASWFERYTYLRIPRDCVTSN